MVQVSVPSDVVSKTVQNFTVPVAKVPPCPVGETREVPVIAANDAREPIAPNSGVVPSVTSALAVGVSVPKTKSAAIPDSDINAPSFQPLSP